MEVKFPLIVFERDDHSMFLIETPERLLHRLEKIDIENNEYLFWDSSGASVCVSVAHGAKNQIAFCDNAMSLAEAFEAYARSYRLRLPLGGSPLDIGETYNPNYLQEGRFGHGYFANRKRESHMSVSPVKRVIEK